MKTAFLVLAAIVITGCQSTTPKLSQTPTGVVETRSPQLQIVTVAVDDGLRAATYSATVNNEATALSVLNQIAEKAQLTVLIKKYDFGSLVTSINGQQNSAKRAWIYLVNGKSGEVGADQKAVKPGDTVEWKFIQPIY